MLLIDAKSSEHNYHKWHFGLSHEARKEIVK